MSACLGGFLACCVFVLLLVLLWRSQPDAAPRPTEALRLFRDCTDWKERVFVLFLCSPILLRAGLASMLLGLGSAAFTALGAICGAFDAQSLHVIRLILRDFWQFVERLIHGTDGKALMSGPSLSEMMASA
jgi:hypothetical protein